MKLWIVNQVVRAVVDIRKDEYVRGHYTAECVGVFESEELAIAACRDEHYFIASYELNEQWPHDTVENESSYYPLADKDDEGKTMTEQKHDQMNVELGARFERAMRALENGLIEEHTSETNTYEKKNKRVKRPKLEPWRKGTQHRIHQHQVRAAPNGFRC